MAFLEELPTWSTVIRAITLCSITLMLAYNIFVWIYRASSKTKRPTLPPSVSLLKAMWGGYQSGLPVYEYARKLRYIHGDIYRLNVFGHRVVVLNDFESIKEAYSNPYINDRPRAGLNEVGESGE